MAGADEDFDREVLVLAPGLPDVGTKYRGSWPPEGSRRQGATFAWGAGSFLKGT